MIFVDTRDVLYLYIQCLKSIYKSCSDLRPSKRFTLTHKEQREIRLQVALIFGKLFVHIGIAPLSYECYVEGVYEWESECANQRAIRVTNTSGLVTVHSVGDKIKSSDQTVYHCNLAIKQ